MSCPLQFLKLLYTGIEYQSLSVQTNLLLIPLHVQSKLRKIQGLFKKQNGNQGLFKAAQAHEILLITGFVPFFGLKIQGLFKDFSRTYFSFFKDSTNCKIKGCSPYSSNCAELKSSLKSMPFLVHPQHSQFCTQGLCEPSQIRHSRI